MIFKNGSSMCTKCFSGQLWKKLTNFWIASFSSNACSTLWLLSLSCAKQTKIESNAINNQYSSSRKLRYMSRPPWALNCSPEFRDTWAISHRSGNAYCFRGESDICTLKILQANLDQMFDCILSRTKHESLDSFCSHAHVFQSFINYVWDFHSHIFHVMSLSSPNFFVFNSYSNWSI